VESTERTVRVRRRRLIHPAFGEERTMTQPQSSKAPPLAVVTGSNTGIGKETARGLVKRGYRVVMACRDARKAAGAAEELKQSDPANAALVETAPLDLGSFDSIRGFAVDLVDRWGDSGLDLLVNNAGLWPTTRSTTADGLETTFGVNHVGTFLLTRELLPLLKKAPAARVVNLTSKLHYRGKMVWDDLQFEQRSFSGPTAYNQSKLANVLFTKALARRLQGTSVTTNAVHPGVVTTELARDYPTILTKLFHLFTISPEQGAACSLYVATAPELAETTGAYFESSKEKAAAKAACDEAAQERLWTLTEDLLAVRGVRASS
jgi:NAD(P)-dependent dehydrogenase (short-subunit alcohol dehydrogenase family)